MRDYIKARCNLGLRVKGIHDEICVVYGISISTVCRWLPKFSAGQESMKDVLYIGRHRAAVTKSNIIKIYPSEIDAHFTVMQAAVINEKLGFSTCRYS